MRIALAVALSVGLVACGPVAGDVEGDLYRFNAGEPVEVGPVDGVSMTIVVAFDYLAAEYLPDVSPSWIYCMLSGGLSVYSMERSDAREQYVGGENVTPIMTIRARGESGVLECQNVITPGPDELNEFRAVVFSSSRD